MRPRVVDLRVDQLKWEPLGPPGLYSRLLSRDPETGARTALQWLSPSAAYVPPQTAHFHHTYEEILGVSGCFSFDSRRWVGSCTYVFHPPLTVHGFKSAIREESTFLSRVGRDLDFNFVEEPLKDDLYTAEGDPPQRQAVALDGAQNLEELGPATFLGGAVSTKVLSVDPVTGEGSAIVRLPEGWRNRVTKLAHYLEIFVLEGGIGVDGAKAADERAYFFYPPGDAVSRLDVERQTLAYVNFGGPIGL